MDTVHRQMLGFSRVSSIIRVSRVRVRIKVSDRVRITFYFQRCESLGDPISRSQQTE